MQTRGDVLPPQHMTLPTSTQTPPLPQSLLASQGEPRRSKGGLRCGQGGLSVGQSETTLGPVSQMTQPVEKLGTVSEGRGGEAGVPRFAWVRNLREPLTGADSPDNGLLRGFFNRLGRF